MFLLNKSFRAVRAVKLALAASVVVLCFDQLALYAQSGLRASLEQLDRNGNGEIEPSEITPLARPYLERIYKGRRLSLDRAHPISVIQEAARTYHAMQNGIEDARVRPSERGTILPFGSDPNAPVVPEFGLAEVKYPYTEEDLREADRTLRRSDRNRDGYIDRQEAEEARWTHSDPFDMDLDKDDRLSRLELAQRFARRRLLQGSTSELIKKYMRVGSEVESSSRSAQRDEQESDWRRWRRGGSETWLAASVMSRFDTNRNGRLEASEAQALGIPMGTIDIDRDGTLSRQELQAYFDRMQQEAGGDEAQGLPGWFYELDTDRDGQISMAEFTSDWTEDKFAEFASLDRNDDGLLTADEVAMSKSIMGGSFSNQSAEVLPPRKTVISEIEITEDITIRDLDLQLSITHTRTGQLDGYLTGPDGQRIELFSNVGGDGDNFDQTRFDDQADRLIVKEKPPFQGSYQPKALVKREPSLSHFNGQNARGVWQLVIRGTRSDRFGMLHQWSLIIQPQE